MKDSKPVMFSYFKSMNSIDFYKLVAILIHFGYKKIPAYRLAWSCDSLCYDPFVAKIISRKRFESLLSFLHVVDKKTEDDLRGEDKLLKVRPLVDHINKKCEKYCQPNMNVSIDERMVRSKARFSFKQYIRNKPTKWGFKLWCLCNASNGYTVKFSVYRGKTGEVVSGNGLGYDVVFRLMEKYLDQGYSLYVDNFYTSPILASDLFARKTHITGTLDRTRKGVPWEVGQMYEKMKAKSSQRGDGLYTRDDKIVYTTWKDTKCICVLSTVHPGYSDSTVKRNAKDSSGHHEKRDVPIPLPVFHYNQQMGGVDRSDQLIHYYNVLRQTRKYWKTLFFHCIDIAVVNSYIIHKENVQNPLSHYKFREQLVKSLSSIQEISDTRAENWRAENLEMEIHGKESTCHVADHVSLDDHQFIPLYKKQPCIYCKLVDNKTVRTTRKCGKCQAPLCFRDRHCFFKWHHSKFKEERERWLKTIKTDRTVQPKVGRPMGAISKARGKRRKRGW